MSIHLLTDTHLLCHKHVVSYVGGGSETNQRSDEHGKIATFISFWAVKASIDRKDITALRDAFGVGSGIWVEWIDSEKSRYIRARPKKEG